MEPSAEGTMQVEQVKVTESEGGLELVAAGRSGDEDGEGLSQEGTWRKSMSEHLGAKSTPGECACLSVDRNGACEPGTGPGRGRQAEP